MFDENKIDILQEICVYFEFLCVTWMVRLRLKGILVTCFASADVNSAAFGINASVWKTGVVCCAKTVFLTFPLKLKFI